jgi:transposase
MPPDMGEWLPEDDLAWVVLDAVGQCDLGVFIGVYREDGQGRPAFDPAMMVALLLYANCHGVRSSREIERRCVRDVAFRVIAAGHRADHATIVRFRARHEGALQTLFTEILRLCAEAGMVRLALLAIDGTKVDADASWSANRTLEQLEAELAWASAAMLAQASAADAAEDDRFGQARGDELPEPLRTRSGRLERLAEARDRLIAERQARLDAQQAKIDAWQARKDTGHPKPGPTPTAPPRERSFNSGSPLRANTTDPQARTVRTKNTMIVGYNAQPVVTADQVIVGTTVVQKEVDRNLLHDVLDTTRCQLRAAGMTPRLRTLVADSGYVTEAAFAQAHADKIRLLAPLAKDTRRMREGGDPADGQNLTRRPETARGQRRLRHWRGRTDYAQRGRTVGPVFGQLKTRQNMTRFSRRGITAVTSEWHLAAAAHNLLKLDAHRRR